MKLKLFVFAICMLSAVSICQAAKYESIENLKEVALSGDAMAQFDLGMAFYYGDGVHQSYREAAKWFEKAAEQGITDAQNNMGLLYATGNGVKQNFRKSFEWHKQAAEAGNAVSQYNVGLAYDFGRGVQQISEKQRNGTKRPHCKAIRTLKFHWEAYTKPDTALSKTIKRRQSGIRNQPTKEIPMPSSIWLTCI